MAPGAAFSSQISIPHCYPHTRLTLMNSGIGVLRPFASSEHKTSAANRLNFPLPRLSAVQIFSLNNTYKSEALIQSQGRVLAAMVRVENQAERKFKSN